MGPILPVWVNVSACASKSRAHVHPSHPRLNLHHTHVGGHHTPPLRRRERCRSSGRGGYEIRTRLAEQEGQKKAAAQRGGGGGGGTAKEGGYLYFVQLRVIIAERERGLESAELASLTVLAIRTVGWEEPESGQSRGKEAEGREDVPLRRAWKPEKRCRLAT